MSKDYYATLGVSRAADAATIHSAFRALARQYHPDAGTGASTTKFREATEAYHTLSDPILRRQHDIDLGKPATRSNVVPESLYGPRRSPDTIRPINFDFDEIVDELFRLMESEFNLPRRIYLTFL